MIAELAVRRGLTLVRVATKVDKLGRAERERRLGSLAKATAGGRWIPFSAETGEGAEALCAAFLEVARGS
jgi:GTP-binding protein EngB required for normal cell division